MLHLQLDSLFNNLYAEFLVVLYDSVGMVHRGEAQSFLCTDLDKHSRIFFQGPTRTCNSSYNAIIIIHLDI